jgi:hypothetical protein
LFGKEGERQWKAVYRAGRAPSPGARTRRRTQIRSEVGLLDRGVVLSEKKGGAAVGGRSGARTRRRTRIRYEVGLLDRGVGLSEKKGERQ